MTQNLSQIAIDKALKWAKEPFDAETRAEVQALLDAKNQTEIDNRFALDLEFGTAGLRGVMGAGTTMMNKYMIAKTSKALALCLKKHYAEQNAAERGIVIGFDCRKNSSHFAQIAAEVVAAQGVKVYLLDRLTPTPVIPFLLRQKKAYAGVVVTSSHNPPKYNGYKVFWESGAQIISPVDTQIAAETKEIDEAHVERMDLEEAKKQGLIVVLTEKDIHLYTDWATKTSIKTKENDVDLVYTPLGGTGCYCATTVLKNAGFTKVHVVEEEKTPGPDFAGLQAPNPEHAFAWPRAIELGEKMHAEIILANDGDADRLGVAIASNQKDYDRWSEQGVARQYYSKGATFRRLTGNQIGALMLYHLLNTLPEAEKNTDTFALCSVVSSPLCAALSHSFSIDHQETLTGFKWMGNIAQDRENKGQHFLFAYEEAYGFTFGNSRDKDGITAVLLLSELAATCKKQNKQLIDILDEIYLRCGIHLEDAYECVYEGLSGKEKMANIISGLRNNPPKHIAGIDVVGLRDLKEQKYTDFTTGQVRDDKVLPSQNMISFKMADGSWLSIRPSGTEPKIKAYFGVIHKTSAETLDQDLRDCDLKVAKIKEFIKKEF